MDEEQATARRGDGRFMPGQSGNPAGRPKGAKGRATLLAEALQAGEGQKMARNMIEHATGGNRVALAFCLGRLVPRPRGSFVRFDLPEKAERDPAAVHAATARALADGEVTPDEAATIARFLAAFGRVVGNAT